MVQPEMGNTRKDQLKRLLQAHPGDPFLHHALGLEWVKSGDDNQARYYFEKALDLDPNHVGTYYHLAKLHERQHRLSDAVATYKKGLAITHEEDERHMHEELQTALQLLQEEMSD